MSVQRVRSKYSLDINGVATQVDIIFNDAVDIIDSQFRVYANLHHGPSQFVFMVVLKTDDYSSVMDFSTAFMNKCTEKRDYSAMTSWYKETLKPRFVRGTNILMYTEKFIGTGIHGRPPPVPIFFLIRPHNDVFDDYVSSVVDGHHILKTFIVE